MINPISIDSKFKVLFAVWELDPFLKVGGLGEVARSLPGALKSQGVDIRVIIPHYKAIKTFYQRKKLIATMKVRFGKKFVTVTIHQIKFLNADIPVYLLGNEEFFDKPMYYTFALFDAAVVQAIKENLLNSWTPNIIHCNDNHCGLIPLLAKIHNLPVKTLLTIHNIFYQRRFPTSLAESIGVSKDKLTSLHWEANEEKLNFLLEGITHADIVNTVSETYLEEVQTEDGGAGLDYVVKQYREKFSAILNGIDYELKNPATNLHLTMRYSVNRASMIADPSIVEPIAGKKENKNFLQKKLGLEVNPNVILIGFVGRMDSSQKGIDIMHRMLVRYQFPNCQFVIMGQGETAWEERFHALATFSPSSIAAVTRYDDIVASQIYAAADFMIIPSKYEPCGLIQINGMRYGALPIARATGGLNDTVMDGKNGTLFAEYTAQDLQKAILRAIKIKSSSPKRFISMLYKAMKTDFSWKKSASEYIALYQKLLL